MYVILSDVRTPKSPNKLKAFCAWTAGATMVKWNRRNPRLIASVHDGEVFVWDVRKESAPITKITAHKQISSMDWSYHSETQLVTSSTDRTVKFWDYQQPTICQAILQTGNPVSKVRYTPFGRAIITISQRSDFTVRMWSLNDLEQPVYQFMGHKDVVSSLDWRTCDVGEDYEYQLLSWSKDSNLRFWPIDMALINAMQSREAYGAGRSVLPSASTSLVKDGFGSSLGIYPSVGNAASFAGSERDLQATPSSMALGSPRKGGILGFGPNQNAAVSTPNGSNMSNSTISNLEQELAILQRRPIQSVIIEESSLSQRTLQLRVGRLPYLMRLKITFPSLYPHLAAPSFEFLNISEQETRQLLGLPSQSPQATASLLAGPSKLSEEEKLHLKVKAKQLLVKVAYAFVSINLVCVDPCCNQLLELLESFHADPKTVLQPDDPDRELKFKPEEYYKSFSLSSGSVPSTPSKSDDASANTLSTSLGKERAIPRLTFSESASGNGATSTVTQIALSPPLIKPSSGFDSILPKTKSDMNLSRFLDNDYLRGGSGSGTPAGSSPSTGSGNIASLGLSSQSSSTQNIRLPASQSATNLQSMATPTDPNLPVTSSSLVDKSILANMHQAASTAPSNGQNNISASSTGSGPLSPHSAVSGASSTSPSVIAPGNALDGSRNSPGVKDSGEKLLISSNATANFGNTMADPLANLRGSPSELKQDKPVAPSGLKPLSQHAATISGLARLGHREDDLNRLSPAEKLRLSSEISEDGTSSETTTHSLMGDDYLMNPIPAPRTCGAFFYGTGQLCIFGSKQKPLPPGTIPSSKLAIHTRTYAEFLEVVRATSLGKRPTNPVRASIDDLSAYDAFSLDLDTHGTGSDTGGLTSSSMRDSKLPRTVSMSAMSDDSDSESGTDENSREMLHKVSSEVTFSHHLHHHSSAQLMSSLQHRHGFPASRSRREVRKGDLRVEWYDCVAIHDLSMLIPVSQVLAKLYTLSGTSPSSVAQTNILAAKSVRRTDLAKLWSIVEAQLHPSVYPGLWGASLNPDGSGSTSYASYGGLSSHNSQLPLPSPFDRTWAMHPLGKTLLKSLFKRYEQLGDVQTLAMLSCVITGTSTPYGVDALFPAAQRRPIPHRLHHQRSSSLTGALGTHSMLSSYGPSSTSPGPSMSTSTSSSGSYGSLTSTMLPTGSTMPSGRSTIGSVNTSTGGPSNASKSALAMSHMGLIRDKPSDPISAMSGSSSGSHSRASSNPTADAAYLHHSLVEYEDSKQYNRYRRAYAEMLYMWGEFAERANVLKYVADPTPPNEGIDFVILCDRCSKPLKSPYCQNCKIYGFNCDICHLKVKGLSSFCLKCGHGGHAEHLKKWFEKEKVCPTGCGCECMTTDGHF